MTRDCGDQKSSYVLPVHRYSSPAYLDFSSGSTLQHWETMDKVFGISEPQFHPQRKWMVLKSWACEGGARLKQGWALTLPAARCAWQSSISAGRTWTSTLLWSSLWTPGGLVNLLWVTSGLKSAVNRLLSYLNLYPLIFIFIFLKDF